MLTDRLQAELTRAMKARDKVAVRALRTALAAIANAEAPAVASTSGDGTSLPQPPVVGQLVEHARLVLAEADMVQIVQREIDERHRAITEYEQLGLDDEATELRAEAEVLAQQLR
jgi:uncharacterized protein YqeY